RGEPPSIAAKPLQAFSGSIAAPLRPFNAMLDYVDEREEAQPYLAEAIPQLNTDSWRVLADGRMETTYRLKPNLTWHDGRPLTADDFVFALRVYANKDINLFALRPQDQIEDVRAPDPQTVLITWRSPYPGAGVLA